MCPVMPHLGKRGTLLPNGKVPGSFDFGLVVTQSTARMTLRNRNLSPEPFGRCRLRAITFPELLSGEVPTVANAQSTGTSNELPQACGLWMSRTGRLHPRLPGSSLHPSTWAVSKRSLCAIMWPQRGIDTVGLPRNSLRRCVSDWSQPWKPMVTSRSAAYTAFSLLCFHVSFG